MKVQFVLLVVMVPGLACQAEDVPRYAGQQEREIKALSEAEVSGYLDGRGMGLAKAAELNGYPGPAHVLDLAEKLELTCEQLTRAAPTPQQRAKAQQLKDSMKEAATLGANLVDAERQLDVLFARSEASDEKVTPLVEQIGHLQAKIRLVHLRAHLEMRKVLTAPTRSTNTTGNAAT